RPLAEILTEDGLDRKLVAAEDIRRLQKPAGAYLIQSLIRRGSGKPVKGARTNYLGGSASYGPRDKGDIGLIYQKRQLLGQFDRFSFSPTYGVALGGDMTYSAPILSDREDPRRLYNLELSVFSFFRNNRNLAGVETDERRTGGAISLGLRPLGIRGAHDLRFRWRLEHTEIDLDEIISGVEEVDLTILRSSAAYEWRHTHRSPSLSARIVPVIELALDGVGGARSFVRSSIDTGLHGRSRTGFEFDLHLNAGTIDHTVPEFELWDLGGATTVRGFKEDSFLGRHRVALQAELWIPFSRTLPYRPVAPGEPISQPGEIPLERRSARLLKGALFIDGGYLSGTTTGRNETLFGAGVGLRFVVPRQPLVIRLDYAWGLGGRGDDSFAYVSLGYRF
ncbi:MAG: BamA/TamA family outer membrane protein, partial [Acidobacteria bacterium]|nr:BamA/TamA family outer membrane protein [Acidobacteriota bacterium]